MKNIAKLTSYGVYLDCPFTTAHYPDEETHIVGELADYVYDLEWKIEKLEHDLFDAERYLEIEQQERRDWKQACVDCDCVRCYEDIVRERLRKRIWEENIDENT